jgi:hypothetical protein
MITIDGEKVTETYDIWSARFTDKDGTEQEVIYPDGEDAARDDQVYVGGSLWVRKAYATEGNPVAHVEEAELVTDGAGTN